MGLWASEFASPPLTKLPVVGFPQQLYVGQVGGFGDAISVSLHEIRV